VPGRRFIRFFMATWKGGRHSPSLIQPLSWVNRVAVTNWKLHRSKVDISYLPYLPHIMPASILLLPKGKTWWYIQLLHFKVLTLSSVRKVNVKDTELVNKFPTFHGNQRLILCSLVNKPD
jgi:hypothetical protein